jgi:CAI-1 autoinducer synthase
MASIDWLEGLVQGYLEYAHRHGDPKTPFDLPENVEDCICLQENDYLRLAQDHRVRSAIVRAAVDQRVGKLSSSIFSKPGDENDRLCRRLSESMKAERAFLTTAGWTANVGLIEAIVSPDRPVYLDASAHASLWDGVRLSPGKRVIAPHNKPDGMARLIRRHGPGVVVIDAFYSTDGSIAPLKQYVEICRDLNCVLVLDEAHSFGMIGEKGGGLAVALGVQDDVTLRTGSFSKALGGHGGFVVGSRRHIDFLRFRCRSAIFSSSPSEIVAAGNRAALEIVMKNPSRPRRALEMAAVLRREFREHGVGCSSTGCQIVSVNLRGDLTASKLYWALRWQGILMSVFAPPATRARRSFARFSVHTLVTEADMKKTAAVTAHCIEAMGIRDLIIAGPDEGASAEGETKEGEPPDSPAGSSVRCRGTNGDSDFFVC